MAGFNLANYETVDTRIARFWVDHPEGRILPEMTFNDSNTFVFRVEVYTDRDDTRPAAIGHATETITQKGVNSTSALENCETSAIGRALANLNYAASGQRASREEMSKTEQARAAWEAQQGNGTGQRPPQNGHGGNGQANGNGGPPPETPEQKTTRVVGKLLFSANQQQVDWWINKISEYDLGGRDVTNLVSPDVRAALGIGDEKLSADDLVAYVATYAKKHHSGPAHVPQQPSDTAA